MYSLSFLYHITEQLGQAGRIDSGLITLDLSVVSSDNARNFHHYLQNPLKFYLHNPAQHKILPHLYDNWLFTLEKFYALVDPSGSNYINQVPLNFL